ncbi:hypothetical protein [Flavobacterium psychrotrophum]|uniref:hypothetical protein n=1 Tax=Flavobacterium psychrotrophum TaxID=2294119 RepID=UPI000E32001F|nr:hypothetical protein [Flavobacterium psychrotrophum]
MAKEKRLIELVRAIQQEYGQNFYIYAIPGFLSRNFMAYCAMRQDLELLLKYIDELSSNNYDTVIKSSLTYGIITLYGKCYTDASHYKSAKLEAKDLFKQNPEHLHTHNELMKMRHHFIAHRGDTENEVTVTYMLVDMNKNGLEDQIKFRRLKQAGFSEEHLMNIKALAQFIIKCLEPKIQKSGDKVHKALFEIFSPEQITLMLMNNAK